MPSSAGVPVLAAGAAVAVAVGASLVLTADGPAPREVPAVQLSTTPPGDDRGPGALRTPSDAAGLVYSMAVAALLAGPVSVVLVRTGTEVLDRRGRMAA